MKISEWMLEENIDDARAATLFNVSASAIAKWKRGERVPRPDQLIRIYRASQGSVTPNDFVELPNIAQQTEGAAE